MMVVNTQLELHLVILLLALLCYSSYLQTDSTRFLSFLHFKYIQQGASAFIVLANCLPYSLSLFSTAQFFARPTRLYWPSHKVKSMSVPRTIEPLRPTRSGAKVRREKWRDGFDLRARCLFSTSRLL